MTTVDSDNSAGSIPLIEEVRARIVQGRIKPGTMIGSEHALARETGRSRHSVRCAIDELVSDGLVERRPGKGLYVSAGTVQTRTIQVLAGNLDWATSLAISRGVQSVAQTLGVQVQLYDAHGSPESDLQMLQRLPDSGLGGAVIVSMHSPVFCEGIWRLRTTGFPFVLVDQRLRDLDVPTVMADNYDGGYQAGRHLLERGHQRIAFVGDLMAATVQDRLSGLRDAIADACLAFDRSLVADLPVPMRGTDDWSACVQERVADLMRRDDRPTALFCSCDAVARDAYRKLAEMDLRIPEDVSIVGFDDDPLAEWVSPGLTTIAQPFTDMGRAAMEILNRRMDTPSAAPEQDMLPIQLIERGSTANTRREATAD